MKRSSRMLQATMAATLVLLTVGCSDCGGGGGGGGGTAAPPAVTLPAGILGCFGADTTITITGTYVIAGIQKDVSRSGKISELGLKLEVAAEGEDELPDNAQVQEWKGHLLTTTQDADDEDCWELEYKSPAFSIGSATGCHFTAKGTICPGPPCTVTNSSWSVTCSGQNFGQGSWSMP